MVTNHQGYTIIELLIAIAVLGILAAIAYPSYTNYVVKTNRVDVQNEMLQEARNLANYKMARGTFTGATLSNSATTKNYPATGTAQYGISLNIPAGGRSWTISATPKPSTNQTGDGIVQLNHQGWKCWTKGSSTCTLSATSTWDGR